MDKRKRVVKATKASQNLRSLSGWNVFQREKLRELGPLSPSEYKFAVSKLSSDWRALDPDDRDAFEVQAAYEHNLRLETLERPLPSQAQASQDLDPEPLGAKALKKVSVGRLQHNFDLAMSHEIWASPSQLGECVWFCIGKMVWETQLSV